MASRLELWVVPLLLAISACGRTLSEGEAPAVGGTETAGDEGGSASQLGGAGAAGGGVGGPVAGGGAAQSFAGRAGEGPVDTTCGGDLVGNWVAINRNRDDQPVPGQVNECFNLTLSVVEGEVRAFTWVPPTERHASYLLFEASGGFDASRPFIVRDVFTGLVFLDYAAACLMTPQGPLTCEQLTEGLTLWGAHDGAFNQVTCVAQTDGCHCAFDVTDTDAVGGFYTLDTSAVGHVAFTNLGGGYSSADSTYCISEAGLRFGDGFERISPHGVSLTYTKADCHDGQHGPAETGPDCGPVCDKVCP